MSFRKHSCEDGIVRPSHDEKVQEFCQDSPKKDHSSLLRFAKESPKFMGYQKQ